MSEFSQDSLQSLSLDFTELLILGFAATVIIYLFKNREKYCSESSSGLKKIPVVSGGLPLIGHGLSITIDKKGFLHRCFKEYGGIFQLKFFRKNVVVLGDRTHANELFRANDDTLAFYDRLASMY